MRNFRKQFKLVANLLQTVLQYRLDPFEGLSEHLFSVRKKIRHMYHTQTFEEAISEMLVTKQNYQIRNKLFKYEKQNSNKKQRQFFIQIRITAIEKCSCQIYNQQMWEFYISENGSRILHPGQKNQQALVEFIQSVLKFLQFYTLLPLNKHQRNKFMLDYKVNICEADNEATFARFENISNRDILIINEQEDHAASSIKLKYYFNEGKIQSSLKSLLNSKYLQRRSICKKDSLDTIDTNRKVSLYQYYDDEHDITVLSGSDMSEQNGSAEQIELQLQILDQQEFQMLIEQTENQDETFLKDNFNLLKQLNLLLGDYL